MKKILALTAIAAMIAGTANAIPTVTITDSSGNTMTTTSANGVVNLVAVPLGTGNWTINIDTGIGSPPALGYIGTPAQPFMDLNAGNSFLQTTAGPLVGNVLTIDFTVDNLGPINGELFHKLGSLTENNITAVFNVLVNNVVVDSNTSYAALTTAPLIAPAGSTVTLEAVLTATAKSGFISADQDLTVPDSGMTLAMLGAGLAGLVVFARTRKIA